MCDIQDCDKTSSISLAESDSEELTLKKGYTIKKLCNNHNFLYIKKTAKKKTVEYCVDPWGTHLAKAKSNCTVKDQLYKDILGLQCSAIKPVSLGDKLCRQCQEKFNTLILENKVEEVVEEDEEESSLEITSQASSHSGFTQDENLTKLNNLLDSYNVKTVKKNPSITAIEKAMQELKNKVFDSLDNQVSALEGLNLVMI